MKRYVAVLAIALLAGCSGGSKAKELYETGQFEEKQHNIPHAVQLYEEIVKNHPDSPEAKAAAERLKELKAK